MFTTRLLLIALLLVSPFARALEPGSPLPEIRIADKGRLQLTDDQPAWQPFASRSSLGKPTVWFVIAARRSASKLNEPFQQALRNAGLPKGSINAVSIVRLDEAMFGTRGLALDETYSKQRANPDTVIVVDADGVARAAWALEPRGYAVIVTDTAGKVLRFKDGALTAAEIADFIQTIRSAIDG